MTVGEFKKTEIYKGAKHVKYFDVNGVNISDKPAIILDILTVIGTCHKLDGTINVDVDYTE